MAQFHKLTFSGGLLQRGFWLYVWEITTADGHTVLYVGRTGDSSSLNAQSPFNRLSGHLSTNKQACMLRNRLATRDIDPESCRHFEFIAYGPIFPEGTGEREHRERRDIVAALEKMLCDELHRAGYDVLNVVKSRQPLDPVYWATVRAAFSERFSDLLGIRT